MMCEHKPDPQISGYSSAGALAEFLIASDIASEVFLTALASMHGALAKYRPDQPRVPAGNGRRSGEWTTGDYGANEDQSDANSKHPSEAASPQVADNSGNWARYLNPVGSAAAAERSRPPWLGAAPNAQHDAGVKKAIADGYTIYSAPPLAVNVVGFDTSRIYDFVMRDPNTNQLIGVEVKTTQFDTIFVDPVQVSKKR